MKITIEIGAHKWVLNGMTPVRWFEKYPISITFLVLMIGVVSLDVGIRYAHVPLVHKFQPLLMIGGMSLVYAFLLLGIAAIAITCDPADCEV